MKRLFVVIVLLFFAAAGSAPGASPVAPAGAAPAAGLADGRRDYKARCANCHGANALLTMKTARKLGVDPRKLSLMASSMSKDEMAAIIEKGKGKMPGFEKKLTKEQIAGIVEWLMDNRAKRIRKESLIRIKESPSVNPAPAETSGEKQQAAP